MRVQEGIKNMNKKTRKTRNLANSIDVASDNFLIFCHNRNLTPNTLEFYRIRLNSFHTFLEEHKYPNQPNAITSLMLEDFVFHLIQQKPSNSKNSKLSPVSINGIIATLKVFFCHLYKQGIILDNPANNLQKLKVDKKPIIPFSEQQLKVLLRQPDKNTFTGMRDYLIMKTFLGTGIRLSELLNLQIYDVNFNQGSILIRNSKNRHPRVVGIPKKLICELKNYIELHCNGLPGSDYLFQNQDYGQLRSRTIQENISKYGILSGISNIRVSPHTFRHTFSINYLKNGGSTSSLRQQLGHLSINTVEKYLYWSQDDLITEQEKYNPLDKMNL